jgi:hypothetical protein
MLVRYVPRGVIAICDWSAETRPFGNLSPDECRCTAS